MIGTTAACGNAPKVPAELQAVALRPAQVEYDEVQAARFSPRQPGLWLIDELDRVRRRKRKHVFEQAANERIGGYR